MSTAARLAPLPDQVCKLRIELDLAKNRRVKDLYRQPEFHREITIYLRQNDLEISNEPANSQGRITCIELTGSVAGVGAFIDRYLRSDALGIAYDLKYL